ncbi:hypothetical protein FRC04_003764 [Tulasnella sp. 424]|nr:hypothetical protein FRC04_003764 [Tulasnella sp. 424]KAG8961824.1 hypothetical protein FRC05_005692 [Tulasnella sp. 425]
MDGDIMRDFSAHDTQAIPTKKFLIGRLAHGTDRSIASTKKTQEQQTHKTELQLLEAKRLQIQEQNKFIKATIKTLKTESKNPLKPGACSSSSSHSNPPQSASNPSLSSATSGPGFSLTPTASLSQPNPITPTFRPNFIAYAPAFQSPDTAFTFLTPPFRPVAGTSNGKSSQAAASLYHGDLSNSEYLGFLSSDYDITFNFFCCFF